MLRRAFITNLVKSGVPLQVAQKAARHSSPVLTLNIYTHLRLNDMAEAVERIAGFYRENSTGKSGGNGAKK